MAKEIIIKCRECDHKRQYAIGLLYDLYLCNLAPRTPSSRLDITQNVVREEYFAQAKDHPEECPLVKS